MSPICRQPAPVRDQFFLDYAPLWMLLENKTWVLEPFNAIATNDTLVWSNIFSTKHGLVSVLSWQGYHLHDASQCQLRKVQHDTNRKGGDLYNVQLAQNSSVAECQELCCQQAFCAAFVYEAGGYGVSGNCRDDLGGCCWLKYEALSATTAANVTTGLFAAPTPTPASAATVTWPASLVSPNAKASVYYPGQASPATVNLQAVGKDVTRAIIELKRGVAVVVVQQNQ